MLDRIRKKDRRRWRSDKLRTRRTGDKGTRRNERTNLANTADISAALKKKISGFQKDLRVEEVGRVLTVGDGIARVHGLPGAMARELLEFPHEVRGLVLNLEE